MSASMGLPTQDDSGDSIPLPVQVEALSEAVGLSTSLAENAMSDSDEVVEGEQTDSGGGQTSTSMDDSSSSKTGLSNNQEGGEKIANLQQHSMGSFFGPGITKRYEKGNLVASELSSPQERIVTPTAGLMICACGQGF